LEHTLHDMREGRPRAQTSSGRNPAAQVNRRPVLQALFRGLRHSCPSCGSKTLYSSYLRIADGCPACGEALRHHQADDAPPYFTILIAGHIVIPLLMMAELTFAPPMWLHVLIWVPLTAILCLALLPRVKGAIVGLQWAQRMHGFGQDGGAQSNGPGYLARDDQS
jgi:uncharacterized protein (DUF983 family)